MLIAKTQQQPAGSKGVIETECHVVRKCQQKTQGEIGSDSSAVVDSMTKRNRAIEDRLRAELLKSPYWSIRQVSCKVQDTVVTLRGSVPSFYMKQIAQTVVRFGIVDGLVINNRLEVD